MDLLRGATCQSGLLKIDDGTADSDRGRKHPRGGGFRFVERAGNPSCADLFADYDLQKHAEVIPVRNYPDSLPDDLADVRAEAWFYCGALENRPDILEQLVERHHQLGPLLGSAPDAVRRVRDPDWLARTLRAADVPVLDVIGEHAPPNPDGTWIQKPVASAGGRGVRIWDQVAAADRFCEHHFFQKARIGNRSVPDCFGSRMGPSSGSGAADKSKTARLRGRLPALRIVAHTGRCKRSRCQMA